MPDEGAETRPVHRDLLVEAASQLLDAGRRLALVACHQDQRGFRIVYVFTVSQRAPIEIVLTVPRDDAWVPSLAGLSIPAGQFEREVFDLYGVRPEGHPQPYRLVRHAHWPHGWHPMHDDDRTIPQFGADIDSYPFAEVTGDGVYEIAVGPVHAGIIEPGHFRFSVIGETIIHMEPRLWFLHRGVEKLFEDRTPDAGIELAEQITGDTVIGHTLAYAMAVEEAAGIVVNESDRVARALLLELERLYNHVTDLGALATDAGFGIGGVHAQRVRETLMRLNRDVTGHRLFRGAVVIGGVRLKTLPDPAVLSAAADDVQELAEITLGHPIVRDRFAGTAVLPADQALARGALGYVARASGIPVDARRDSPFVELGEPFEVTTETEGDVLARYRVRAREFAVSARVALELAGRLSRAPARVGSRPAVRGAGHAVSFVEGWRGTISHRAELRPDGRLARVKIVDPSFFNWTALPIALKDTIVPDFPLANKSFNQSYAGNDL